MSAKFSRRSVHFSVALPPTERPIEQHRTTECGERVERGELRSQRQRRCHGNHRPKRGSLAAFPSVDLVTPSTACTRSRIESVASSEGGKKGVEIIANEINLPAENKKKSDRQPMPLLKRVNLTTDTTGVQSSVGPVCEGLARNAMSRKLPKPEQGGRIGSSLLLARERVERLTHNQRSPTGPSSIFFLRAGSGSSKEE